MTEGSPHAGRVDVSLAAAAPSGQMTRVELLREQEPLDSFG
jgi:hypothetical protein